MIYSSFKNRAFNPLIGLQISIASPLHILKWSSRKIDNILITGKISEPLTYNFMTKLPEPNGLFCERIFGPLSSWQCNCGLFNKENPVFKSHICKVCGYENNTSLVRRYRMGHIYLNAPIAHIWYLKNLLPLFLNTSYHILNYLLYYKFIDSTYSSIDKSQLAFNLSQILFASNYIQTQLKEINLIKKYMEYKDLLYNNNITNLKRKNILKTINFLNLFILNNICLSWLLLDLLPVIPANLRPLLHTSTGDAKSKNFIMSPLNDIYRLIILKNNRLNRWSQLRGLIPITFELIEKRKIQQLVDLLFSTNNSSPGKLLSNFKGKQNIFRQYILGKRVDFSGRSVIVSGPDLNMGYIGLSMNTSLGLFKPLLLNVLKKNPYIRTLLKASYFLEYNLVIIKRLIKYILNKEIVMINRAPTLHRMNIQGFKPYLIESEALKLFPLACSSFNADFDGDQMGIFLILSEAAKKEAKLNMSFEKNMFSPASYKNMFKFSQNIVIGLNNLLAFKGNCVNNIIFNSAETALKAYNHKLIKLNTPILIKHIQTSYASYVLHKKKYIITSIGRLLLQNLIK